MSGTLLPASTPISQVWRPSAVRVVTLEPAIPTARGTPAPAPLAWPAKDPDDVLDYQFDIAPALTGAVWGAPDGPFTDAVATLDVAIEPAEPGDLALVSAAADGARCVLWLVGGQAGTTYTVTLRVGTQAGRMLSRSVRLPVLALSVPPSTRETLLTDDGLPLTDQFGHPLQVSSAPNQES